MPSEVSHPHTPLFPDDDKKKRERLQIANSVLSLAKQVWCVRVHVYRRTWHVLRRRDGASVQTGGREGPDGKKTWPDPRLSPFHYHSQLLKELDSPTCVSGLSMNPWLYHLTRAVLLSALSAAVSDSLGFKLQLKFLK